MKVVKPNYIPLRIIEDVANQTIEIEGSKFSYAFFLGMGHGFKLYQPFVITEREDGVLTVREYKPND